MRRELLLSCFFLLLTLQVTAQFKPPVAYPTGQTPFGVAVGDFNSDAKLDLVVTNSDGNTVSILLGKGDGTFKPRVDYVTGVRPTSVVVGDFNGDGKPDLATSNSTSGTVSILLGRGDGTFQSNADYTAQVNPQFLVMGDFNRDGRLDLAASNYASDSWYGSVSIFLGNGDGTFQAQRVTHVGYTPFGIMAGDFDHDSNLDLAVLDNNGGWGVYILPGNGDGSFQSPLWFGAGTNPRQGVVADFNGDGNLDLAIGNCLDNDVSVLFGDGHGNFSGPANYAAGSYVQKVGSGDFDGNGKVDLVVANNQANSVSVVMNNGDGTFQPRVDYAAGNGPMDVAAGDFNGDGAADIAVANIYGNSVSILLNTEVPDFSLGTSTTTPITLKAGQSATSTFSMETQYGFNRSVDLTCAVTPVIALGPKCAFNPTSISPGTSATLSITTVAKSTALDLPAGRQRKVFYALSLPFAGLVVFAMVLGSPRSHRRRLTSVVLSTLVVGGMFAQIACGGNSNNVGGGSPGTPAGNYTITVTGTSGSAVHTSAVALTVQ